MVSIYKQEKSRESNSKIYVLVELRGLSTDDKPTQLNEEEYVDNGSMFVEINTGDIYIYDLDSETWNKI